MTTFTVADLDEWIATVELDVALPGGNATHYPNDWARNGLAAMLGEPITQRLWASDELLATLRRARQAVSS